MARSICWVFIVLFARLALSEEQPAPKNHLPLSVGFLRVMQCPSDVDSWDGGYTSYVAVVGPNTASRTDEGVKMSEIKDPKNTILVVEMKNSGIKWAEPRDLDLENLPDGITKDNLFAHLSNHPGGFNALFADGHVEFIPVTIPWSDFEALVSIRGEKKIEREQW